MISLDDKQVSTLLDHMALDSEGFQVRQIAVMDNAGEIEFSDEESGESFDNDTVERIYAKSRERTYHCYSCGEDKLIAEWDSDSHGVNLCTACYEEAGLENEHRDGEHDEHDDPNCPMCQDARVALEDAAEGHKQFNDETHS